MVTRERLDAIREWALALPVGHADRLKYRNVRRFLNNATQEATNSPTPAFSDSGPERTLQELERKAGV